MVFAGINSYNGSTFVNEGTLQSTSATGLGFGAAMAAIGLGNSNTLVQTGATLDLAPATAMTVNESLVLNGGALINSGSGTTTIDSGIAAVNLLNLGSGGVATSGTVAIGGTGSGATATITVSAGALTSFTLNTPGSGYVGTVPITFTIEGQTTPSDATARLSFVNLTGTTNSIGGDGSLNIKASVSDGLTSGGFTKIGNGTLTFSGANTYTAPTFVWGGTLRLNGSGTSVIAVNAGTLDGTGDGTTTGVTSGTVTIGDGAGNDDAILSPGNSVGTFTTTNSLSLMADGLFKFEIDSTLGIADKMVANGVTIDIGAAFNLIDLNPGPGIVNNTVFTVIDNTSGAPISGEFGNLANASTFTVGNYQYVVNYSGGTGNDLTLKVTSVPEPDTLAAVLGGIGLLLGFRRRNS